MADEDRVELGRTDLGSFLGDLADQVRRDALAAAGLAYRHADPGAVEHRDLMALTISLERSAAVIEAVGEQLCGQCGLLAVVEQVTFGKAPPGARGPRREGGRKDARKESQDPEGGEDPG